MPRGLSAQLPSVKYPDLGVTAAHSDLIGEERIEADGGDGLVTADQDVLSTEVSRAPGLDTEVEPSDCAVLPGGEEGVGVPGDGDGLVDGLALCVELGVVDSFANFLVRRLVRCLTLLLNDRVVPEK